MEEEEEEEEENKHPLLLLLLPATCNRRGTYPFVERLRVPSRTHEHHLERSTRMVTRTPGSPTRPSHRDRCCPVQGRGVATLPARGENPPPPTSSCYACVGGGERLSSYRIPNNLLLDPNAKTDVQKEIAGSSTILFHGKSTMPGPGTPPSFPVSTVIPRNEARE